MSVQWKVTDFTHTCTAVSVQLESDAQFMQKPHVLNGTPFLIYAHCHFYVAVVSIGLSLYF
jgi:hypothetical protein